MATKSFYEINVSDFRKARLIKLYSIIVSNNGSGWATYIDNLEMIVDEKERILIRGWATKRHWEKFLKNCVNNSNLDYIYKENDPE